MQWNLWGPATVLVVALAIIIGIAGAIVCITNPGTLSFDSYLKALVGAIVGTGLLGIGRGHAVAAQTTAPALPAVDEGPPPLNEAPAP